MKNTIITTATGLNFDTSKAAYIGTQKEEMRLTGKTRSVKSDYTHYADYTIMIEATIISTGETKEFPEIWITQ